jgi:hypothetical protein
MEGGPYFTKFNDAFFIVTPIFKYLNEEDIVPYEDFSGEDKSEYLNHDYENTDGNKLKIGMMEHIFGKYNYTKYGSYYLVNANAEDKLDKVYDGMLGPSFYQKPIKLAFHIVTKIKGEYDDYPDFTDEKRYMQGIINRAINIDFKDYQHSPEERMKRYSKLFYQQGGKRSRGKRSRGKRSRGKRSRGKRSRGKRSRGKRSRSKQSRSKQSRTVRKNKKSNMRKTKHRKSKHRKTKHRKSKHRK